MTNSRQHIQRPIQRRNHAEVQRSIESNYSSRSDDSVDDVESNENGENNQNSSNSINRQVIEIL